MDHSLVDVYSWLLILVKAFDKVPHYRLTKVHQYDKKVDYQQRYMCERQVESVELELSCIVAIT